MMNTTGKNTKTKAKATVEIKKFAAPIRGGIFYELKADIPVISIPVIRR